MHPFWIDIDSASSKLTSKSESELIFVGLYKPYKVNFLTFENKFISKVTFVFDEGPDDGGGTKVLFTVCWGLLADKLLVWLDCCEFDELFDCVVDCLF